MRGLTIRRLLCAAAVLACAVLIAFHGGAAAYFLLWASLAIPLLSFIHSRAIGDRFRVLTRVENHTVLRGERTVLHLMLVNDSSFPIPDIEITLTEGKALFPDHNRVLRTWLAPKETKVLDLTVLCPHCGECRPGAERIVLRDIFALSERVFSATGFITVRPRNLHPETLVIAPVNESERRRAAMTYLGERMPDGQLRPYVEGDDVRRINWKASQAAGRLMTRATVPEPKTEIVLIPDTRSALPEGAAGWHAADSITEGTLLIADYFMRHAIALRVVTDSGHALPVRTPADYDRLYALAAEGLFKGQDAPDTRMEAELRRSGGRRYIVLTWDLDDALLRTASRIIESGGEVTLLYIGDDEAAKDRAGFEERLTFRQITSGMDIYSVLTGLGEGAAS